MTPEILAKIPIWRARALSGDLSEEDLREALIVLRQGRLGAHVASDASRKKKARASIEIDADDLARELEGL